MSSKFLQNLFFHPFFYILHKYSSILSTKGYMFDCPSESMITCKTIVILFNVVFFLTLWSQDWFYACDKHINMFSNESVLPIRWPNNCSFSFNFSPSNEDSGLIFFRIDWFDPLAVQGTIKSLLQHLSSRASILQHSVFFIIQLSYPHTTAGKNILLTRQTFVGKVMSLLFKMLSGLAIAFLPRSKCLLISWLQSHSAVILEPKKMKSVTASIVSPSICHEVERVSS